MSERVHDESVAQLERNLAAQSVPSETRGIQTAASSLEVRLRGGYITEARLTSPSSGQAVDVLYADTDLNMPKISASHVMLPAGPYEGVGGQHGFPRWADYDIVPTEAGADPNQSHIIFRARQHSETGLELTKGFTLYDARLDSHTTVTNSGDQPQHTSIGEHLYFSLANELFDGLRVDGRTLDEAFGPGAQQQLLQNQAVLPNSTPTADGTIHWSDFSGQTVLDFPAGHRLRLSAAFEGTSAYPLVLWVWHRPSTPSICFEPIAGVNGNQVNTGVILPPGATASLTTTIELL